MIFPRTTAITAAVAGMLLAAPTALAAESGEDTPLNLPKEDAGTVATSGGGSMVRTVVGLAIVLAVIYGLYWVLKQVKASREGAASGQGLETVASVPLGTNRSMHLVRAGSELVLLGVSEHAVVPIRSYTEEEAMAAGLIEVPGLPAATGDGTPARRPAATPASAAVVLRSALDRLQRVTVRG